MSNFIIFVIAALVGIIIFVYEIKNKQEFSTLLGATLFILFGLYNSVIESQIFDEVTTEQYVYMKEHKSICMKYEDCKIFYSQIWDDGKVTNYEFRELVNILDEKPEVIEVVEEIKKELRKH